MLLWNEKEAITDTGYNMDEPWKCYAERKKLVRKGHILYVSISVKCPEQADLLR